MSAKGISPGLSGSICCFAPILEVLDRVRLNDVGNMAGIEKAYLQISVAEYYCDSLRFLWFHVQKEYLEIKKICFGGVNFGVDCSQYMLISVISHR